MGISVCRAVALLGWSTFRLGQAVCPASMQTGCGECPASISGLFSADGKVQILGNRNMRCTQAGLASLRAAHCPQGSCYSLGDIDFPFAYDSCASASTDTCAAWKWLHCAFPDDTTASGSVMHAYFFVQGSYQGMGFDFAERDVAGLLAAAGANLATGKDLCAESYPEQARVAQVLFESAVAKGAVLFGWDGCPCTAIAQSRFAAAGLCLEQLTWSNPNSLQMAYLQCMVGDTSHHSFLYMRNAAGEWEFRGNGFDFDRPAMSEQALEAMALEGNVAKGCQSVFTVNIYGEPLSECWAAKTDVRGSWMWDGKCTERNGGVHQVCMSELPADFSVTTGQGPWSEGRANMRHCVCIGAWSLYMTRDADPQWTTSSAWPFCDAVPMSALTVQYIGKWKDWNGIPAQIELGAEQIVRKCLAHRSGPGSEGPTTAGACQLLKTFRALQEAEPDLNALSISDMEIEFGVDCVNLPEPERDTFLTPFAGETSRGGTHGDSPDMNETSVARAASLASKFGVALSSISWVVVQCFTLRW